MTEQPHDFTGAELDEPLVDDLLDETRRPEGAPTVADGDEDKQQPDPPATPEVPEPPD